MASFTEKLLNRFFPFQYSTICKKSYTQLSKTRRTFDCHKLDLHLPYLEIRHLCNNSGFSLTI
jgi:hypothetical protein